MRRRIPLIAEFFAGFDDADAENLLPQPVDGDPRRERIGRVDDPAGQSQAIELDSRRGRMQCSRNARPDRFSSILEFAAHCNVRRPLGAFFHHQRRRDHLVHFGLNCSDFFLTRYPVGRRAAMMCRQLVELRLSALIGRQVDDCRDLSRKCRAIDGRFPLAKARIDARGLFVEAHFRLGQPRGQPRAVPFAPHVRRFEHRRLAVVVFGRIEDREELVIFLLGKRVVLVVVALGAADRRPHPDLHRCVHPIDDRSMAVFFGIRAPFRVVRRVAMKTGGDQLCRGRVGEQIARQQLDCELVVRQVCIERFNKPVSPPPDRARRIVNVALRIAVARQIEPDGGPSLTVFALG